MNYFSEKEREEIAMKCLESVGSIFEKHIKKVLLEIKDDGVDLKNLLGEASFILNNISACLFINMTASFFKRDFVDGCPSVFKHSYLEEAMAHNFAKILRTYVENYNAEFKCVDENHNGDEKINLH